MLACTSGTAAANYAPAVHEAREAGVPLLVLTADRPPELREVGAGQVIDQVKLYGSAAKWFFEVGSHDASPERLRWMRALACRAVATACSGRPGVVHLNFPLRDPLVPPPDLPPDESGRPDDRAWLPVETPRADPPVALVGPGHKVVVAGTGAGAAAARFAAAGQFPLLADPLSGARRGPAAIARYDHLLRDEAFVTTHRPDVIVRIGDLPTSKPLRAWLERFDDIEQLVVPGPSTWHDPMSTGAAVLNAPVEGLRVAGDPAPDWLAAWRTADDRADAAIAGVLGDELTEPRVALELGASLDRNTLLWVASSMPIRDVEAFFPVRDDGPRVLSNRGANGIDGTVSSALGAAVAVRRVVLLIGDVALAHDIGGLLAAKRHGLAITIVLLNNDGGGIFEFLPVATEGDAYVEHVATPLGLDFAHAAALYDCEHVVVETLDAFRREVLPAPERTKIVEVRTDRAENRALHAQIAEAVLAR